MKCFLPCILSCIAMAMLCTVGQAALINGDFEDLSGTFPTGWIPGGTVSQASGLVAGSTTAAGLATGASIVQDADLQAGETEIQPFQLDFVMSLGSNLASGSSGGTRIRLRGDSSSTNDFITLSLNGTGLQKYGPSWFTAVPAASFPGDSVAADTPYYIRVLVDNLDADPALEYQLGVSTDGSSYVNSIVMGSFHGLPDTFETIRFEAGSAASLDVDNVSYAAIPEPSSFLLFGLAGLAILTVRRRR